MKIAYTMATERGGIDTVLFEVAQQLMGQGVQCCGAVQVNTDRAAGPCDMDVKLLPDGPTLCISQNLGAASRGCRLDPAALEQAVGLAEQTLTTGADILIINKFGKHEADGRGFRSAIAQAIAQDIPVLVGVNALNYPAFAEFAGDQATQITPSAPQIVAWCQDAMAAKMVAA